MGYLEVLRSKRTITLNEKFQISTFLQHYTLILITQLYRQNLAKSRAIKNELLK